MIFVAASAAIALFLVALAPSIFGKYLAGIALGYGVGRGLIALKTRRSLAIFTSWIAASGLIAGLSAVRLQEVSAHGAAYGDAMIGGLEFALLSGILSHASVLVLLYAAAVTYPLQTNSGPIDAGVVLSLFVISPPLAMVLCLMSRQAWRKSIDVFWNPVGVFLSVLYLSFWLFVLEGQFLLSIGTIVRMNRVVHLLVEYSFK